MFHVKHYFICMKRYDVIVIGAGHAGCEAATFAAKLKTRVLLITKSLDNIGELSCNPSIGGVGKGVIVREIDALNGIMPIVADESAIHYKILNSSKGPAAWGIRTQVDRSLYKINMQARLKNNEYLDIIFSEVEDILLSQEKAIGVKCNNESIFSDSVVITCGTFLNGKIHIGNESYQGGRANESSVTTLANRIAAIGFDMMRFKTGTPPRLEKDSIDFDVLEKQDGDVFIGGFSNLTKKLTRPQISCYTAYTNDLTHEIITKNIHLSPMYSGGISSSGPRYCPSIEDKIIRFSDKNRHQIFLEPEGLDNHLVYPNGISTSLPRSIQENFIRSIKGLEKARIIRYGYAIEYDCLNPRELSETLESKRIQNLFFAGQINGTTGYEEAAGQGMIAGINAALKIRGESFKLSRGNAYIGVMIDDLIKSGVNEPYRMMTSRAEYRIILRGDNAPERLTPIGDKIGLISDVYKKNFEDKLSQKKDVLKFIKSQGRSFIQKLMNKETNIFDIKDQCPKIQCLDIDVVLSAIADSIYENYKPRLENDIAILKNEKNFLIPSHIDFEKIPGLSNEMKERLKKSNLSCISDIRKVQGMTPAALIVIMLYIKKHSQK